MAPIASKTEIINQNIKNRFLKVDELDIIIIINNI